MNLVHISKEERSATMSIELIVASVAITCALVLYTFGVFGVA